ncbi:MAG: toprim domain-containing protein [Candidatus Aenigmarchaeota archaeon]|nr:toprim domain-containing protein [Candidatus Aenigmarchaeota archaeon]
MKFDLIRKFSGVPIIVEGKNDKIALTNFGFENVFDISGNSLHKFTDFIETLGKKSVTVLTDFDAEGESKNSRLIKLLESSDIIVDKSLRRKFKNSFKIHKIEEMKSLTKFTEDDYYGEIGPINNKIFDRSRIHNRRNRRKT